jgi:hypothetical protein
LRQFDVIVSIPSSSPEVLTSYGVSGGRCSFLFFATSGGDRMSRPYKCTVFYTNAEEVLESSIWYLEVNEGNAVDNEMMRFLAERIRQQWFDQFRNVCSRESRFYGVKVSTPLIDGVGPSSYWAPASDAGQSSGLNMADVVFYNFDIFGGEANGRPVTGGVQLSLARQDQVNCNTIPESFRENVETRFDTVFPFVIDLSQSTLQRIVRRRNSDGTYENVFSEQLRLNARLGVRVDRVGNKPNNRKRLSTTATANPDTDPNGPGEDPGTAE